MLTRRAILVAASALSYSHFAAAQSAVSYVGAPGGFWHVATNWQPQVIPDNNLGAMPPVSYTARVDKPVIINGGQFDISGVTNTSSLDTLSSWDFQAGIGGGAPFLNNTGTVSIAPPMFSTAFISVATGNTLTITGGGTFRLGGDGLARILGNGTLINGDNTIRGEGNIGEGGPTIINNATIASNEASPGVTGTLNVFPGPGGLRNNNTLQARANSILTLRGVFNNGGGNIVADAGGNVQMGLLEITGGTLSSAAGGSISINNNTEWIGAIAHTGNTVVNNDLTLSGVTTNSGSISVAAAMRIDTEAELAGNGTIFLTGGSINRVGPAVATLTTSNHITGRGQIGGGTLTVINAAGGSIRASGGGSILITNSTVFFNNGTLSADSGTLQLFGGDFLNGSGTIHAANNNSVRLIGVEIIGGTLSTAGNGTVNIPTATTSQLSGVTVDGLLVVASGASVRATGLTTGNGTLDLIGGSSLRIVNTGSTSIYTRLRPGSIINAAVGPFFAPESDPLFFNSGTIAGSGTISQNDLQIINNGVLRGDGGGAGLSNPLALDPSGKGLLNSGIIEAADLGVVILNGGTGAFTQNGTAVIRATDPGSNVQLIGTSITGGQLGAGGGSITSSGAVRFESLTTDANVIQVGVGQILINQNVVNTGTITTPSAAAVIVANAATLNSASGHHINQGSININGGGFADFNFVDNVSTISVGQVVVSSNGQMMAHSIDQGALTIQNNAFGTLKSSFAPSVDGSIVNNLSIGTIGAALDATNRGMAVTAGSINTIRDQIISGYAGGAWTGFGIRSSSAAANPGFGVGYAVANQIGSPPTFLGRPITPTSALFRYTLLGDANLNGTVNINDFSLLAANFNTAGPWVEGDFNYDQFVNISDFALLASNFNRSLPADLPRESIPEPVSLIFVASAFAVLKRQRARFTRSAPPHDLVGFSDTTSSAA